MREFLAYMSSIFQHISLLVYLLNFVYLLVINNESTVFILLYIIFISEKIEWIFLHQDIKVNFQTWITLRQLLVHVHIKHTTPIMKKKGVLYSIPSMDCISVYMSEIGRNFERGLQEHQCVWEIRVPMSFLTFWL